MPDPATPAKAPPRLSVALGAVGAGASWGAVVVVAGLIVFRSWQASGNPLPERIPLLSGPLLIGLVVGVAVSWWVSRPLADGWRQTVSAGLALFGTAMLAALAAPADSLGGRTGLAVYGALLLISGWSAQQRARKAAATL